MFVMEIDRMLEFSFLSTFKIIFPSLNAQKKLPFSEKKLQRYGIYVEPFLGVKLLSEYFY